MFDIVSNGTKHLGVDKVKFVVFKKIKVIMVFHKAVFHKF